MLLLCASCLPTPSPLLLLFLSPSLPPCLAEPALFSSLLYLLKKYMVFSFSCAYRSRNGCYLFIYLFP